MRAYQIIFTMEDITLILLVLGIYVPTFVGVMLVIKRPNTGKKKVIESSSDSVGEMFDTSSKGYKDIIKVKDNQIRSLTQKLNIATEESDQDDSILEHVPSWEEVKQLAQTQGLNPLILEMPFIKPHVKKLIRGMSIQEITENVAQIKKFAGDKGFKFGDTKGDQSKTPIIGEVELDTTNFV